MAHERSRGLGSLSAPLRMNEEIMTMSLPSSFELLHHHHHDGRRAGFLDHPTNQDDAFYTSCHAGQHEAFTEQGPLALSWWNKDDSVDDPHQHDLCHHHHHAPHRHHHDYHGDLDDTTTRPTRSSTSSTSSDLKTKLRARNANIVRRALQLSNDDCLQQSNKGRGREANHHGDHESTSGEGSLVEHSFQLSALASALPLYDLGEELWQSELSYLFGPMGPAFGGRRGGERTMAKNSRKRELSLLTDTETLGQQGSMSICDTTGELSIDKTTSDSSTTKLSSSPLDQTTFPSSLIMPEGGENKRHYDQEPQEVVERSDVQINLSESSMKVVTPLKRQRRTTSISPTSSNTGTTGLRRASMNFIDLPSL